MINDLPPQLKKTKSVTSAIFADDVAVWISLPKSQEHQLSQIIMSEELTALSDWFN
jgi:hypothetical protein